MEIRDPGLVIRSGVTRCHYGGPHDITRLMLRQYRRAAPLTALLKYGGDVWVVWTSMSSMSSYIMSRREVSSITSSPTSRTSPRLWWRRLTSSRTTSPSSCGLLFVGRAAGLPRSARAPGVKLIGTPCVLTFCGRTGVIFMARLWWMKKWVPF